MNIIEHFICGKKKDPSLCEDGIVIGKNLIAVIDGVTAKGVRQWEGKSSGCYAKCILQEYLQEDVAQQSAEELLTGLDRLIYAKIREQDEFLPAEEVPRAAVIIYNDIYKQIWSYGDCQCSINGQVFSHAKKIDELNSDLRAYYIEYQLLQGADMKALQTDDVGRKRIQDNLLMQFAFENKPGYFGYPVLNGMGIENSMIKKYSVKEGDHIVLASDGYPVLRESLSECERELDRIKEEDPLCFRLYRSTKGIMEGNDSFDDRAFCSFMV